MGNGRSKSTSLEMSIGNRTMGEYMQTDIDFVSLVSNKIDVTTTEYFADQQLETSPWFDNDLAGLFESFDKDKLPYSLERNYKDGFLNRGYPSDDNYSVSSLRTNGTLEKVSNTEMNKARNLSMKFAYNILKEMNKLGIITNTDIIRLRYSSHSDIYPNANGTSTTPLNLQSSAFYNDINIYGQTIFNSITEDAKEWSTSMSYRYGRTAITTAHELGHLFDNYLSRKQGNTTTYISSDIQGNRAVSTYGNKNYKEAFAESFALYVCGIRTTGKSDYHKNFVKFMRDNGYNSLFGCAVRKIPKSITKNFKTKTAESFKHTWDSNNKMYKVTGSINGNSFSILLTKKVLENGYASKKIDGTNYLIDITTGKFILDPTKVSISP